jgi:hypothetical protein
VIKFQDYEKEFKELGITNKDDSDAILQYMQLLALYGIEYLNKQIKIAEYE